MKKVIGLSVAVIGIVFLTSMIIHSSSAQPSQKQGTVGKPIPPGVLKIAEKSCVKCHTEGGNKTALMHLNLSSWNKYSPEKQANKAKAICKMVSKGKMPPKSFRERNPDGVSSQEEIKTICDWANSIQVEKGKKSN